MPRDLFGYVTRSTASQDAGTRLTLPLSMAVHVAAITVLIVAPLVATNVLPTPRRLMQVLLDAPVQPPEPPPPVPASRPPVEAARADIAPLEAPDTITPEAITPKMTDPAFVEFSTSSGIVFGGSDVPSVVEPPPPPPPAREAVRVGGAVTAPTKIVDVTPVYPPIAQAAGVEGLVIIQATIGVDGRVTNATVLRPAPLLEEAALNAVRQWRYTPTRLNGEPVAVVMTVTVSFRLR